MDWHGLFKDSLYALGLIVTRTFAGSKGARGASARAPSGSLHPYPQVAASPVGSSARACVGHGLGTPDGGAPAGRVAGFIGGRFHPWGPAAAAEMQIDKSRRSTAAHFSHARAPHPIPRGLALGVLLAMQN